MISENCRLETSTVLSEISQPIVIPESLSLWLCIGLSLRLLDCSQQTGRMVWWPVRHPALQPVCLAVAGYLSVCPCIVCLFVCLLYSCSGIVTDPIVIVGC